MRILLCVLLLSVPVAAQTPAPVWVRDLAVVAAGTTVDVQAGATVPFTVVKALAQTFATPEALEAALTRLPTKAQRDRARQTLTPFTRWERAKAQPHDHGNEAAYHGGHGNH